MVGRVSLGSSLGSSWRTSCTPAHRSGGPSAPPPLGIDDDDDDDEEDDLHAVFGDGGTVLELSTAELAGAGATGGGNGGGGNVSGHGVMATGGATAVEWLEMVADRVASHRIFIHSSLGALHVLSVPWLLDWAIYLTGGDEARGTVDLPPAPPTPPARIETTALAGGEGAANGIVGVAPVRDPWLGDAVMAMTNDGKGLRVQMEQVEAAAGGVAATGEEVAIRQHEGALQGLAHKREQPGGGSAGGLDDEMAWTRSRAELAAALPADVLPAFERALTVLAGKGSTLRRWGELAEETATRLERLERQAGGHGDVETALNSELEGTTTKMDQLMHMARLAATVQANLEARAKGLRVVLRQECLWPCGGLSADEINQHRRLIGLRDRVREGERALQAWQVRHAKAKQGGREGPGDRERGGVRLSLDAEDLVVDGEASRGGWEAESSEVERQSAALKGMVEALKTAKANGEEALQLAQTLKK